MTPSDQDLIARVREALVYLDTLYIKSESNHRFATDGSVALQELSRRIAELREGLERIEALEPMWWHSTDEDWAKGYGASEPVFHPSRDIARSLLHPEPQEAES